MYIIIINNGGWYSDYREYISRVFVTLDSCHKFLEQQGFEMESDYFFRHKDTDCTEEAVIKKHKIQV